MADDDDTLHNNLTQWITQNGGSVHRNLALHTPNSHEICNDGVNDTITMKTQPYKFSHRGIFAKHGPISKGEVLIRLPCQLALDGSHLPKNYETLACQNSDSDAPLSTAGGNVSKSQQQRNASAWLPVSHTSCNGCSTRASSATSRNTPSARAASFSAVKSWASRPTAVPR